MTRRRGFSFSKALGAALARGASAFAHLFGRRIGARAAGHAASILVPVVSVETARGRLKFHCPSAMSARHATGFLEHEPDTRQWIDAWIEPGDHLWDIGSNIGHYALYACLTKDVTVTAFEPVAGNFAVLVQNIRANGFENRVTPLCMALSDRRGIARIHLASTEAGAAMHALERPLNVQGEFEPQGSQMVPVLRGDDLADVLAAAIPDHIKIDVDGHEQGVLGGLGQLLQQVKTLWIELEGSASRDGTIAAFLAARGFVDLTTGNPAGRNRLFVNRNIVRAA